MITWNLTMPLARWFWKAGTKVKPGGKPLLKLLVVLSCLTGFLQGQNLDLFSSTSSSIHRGLAGAGIALVENNPSGDINPAGLAELHETQIVTSAFLNYYKYQLINERQEDELTRIFKWARLHKSLMSLYFLLPVGNQAGFSLGIRQSLSPFLFNQRRAISWSPLYNQLTQGDIHAAYLSLGYKISQKLSIGVTANAVYGTIGSEVHGENHGNDEDKWAKLESGVSGWGLKTGLHYRAERFQLGLTFEPSIKLEVQYAKEMSSDGLYANLFPESEHSTWSTPRSLGVGTALNLSHELLITMDIEALSLNADMPAFNLYEYGGAGVGGDLLTYRVGGFYKREGILPIRVGYAHLPQAYTSTEKTVEADNSTSITNGERIIKQLYTVGSSATFQNSVINVALEYSVLTWDGELNTYINVRDTYTEQGFGLVVEWAYKLR